MPDAVRVSDDADDHSSMVDGVAACALRPTGCQPLARDFERDGISSGIPQEWVRDVVLVDDASGGGRVNHGR